MTETAVGGVRDRVELAYLPALADAVGAIRARARTTSAGRLQNGITLVFGALTLYSLIISFDGPGGRPAVRSIVVCAVGLAAILSLPLLVPRMQGKQVHQMFASRGDFRAVVEDATGVTLYSRDVDMVYRWPMLGRYTETDELFVLMSPDKYGISLVVLPKRGAAPGDVDRIRAILDRRSRRVGRRR